MEVMHRFDPYRLPNPRRSRIEDPGGLFLPVLLAPRKRRVPAVIDSFYHDRVVHTLKQVRNIRVKRRMTAFVNSREPAVHPYFAFIVHGTEMQN
ncbi:hypothetical protein BGX30_004157 [Mortierella sp. GBA39]|nr:hypothetical protein BGX30_004157 [Mortierella sp. GBA39]